MAFKLQAFLKAVGEGKTLIKYRKGETVFAQGDPCDGVFYVQSGDCKVSVISEQGKEAVVALHGKGDFFGEGCLNGQPRRLATVTAMSDLKLLRFESAAIQRMLHDEPDFSAFFISYLLTRNARVEADLVDQLFNSSEKRLVARMHKYNNQDHAMMTSMLTVKNILAGEKLYDVWNVNEDAEYQEAGACGGKDALNSLRLVPSSVRAKAQCNPSEHQ